MPIEALTETKGHPRELRRRAAGDDCILNISSRDRDHDSLAHTGAEESVLEFRRGEHVIAARVVALKGFEPDSRWRLSAAGEIMSVSGSRTKADRERRSVDRTPPTALPRTLRVAAGCTYDGDLRL